MQSSREGGRGAGAYLAAGGGERGGGGGGPVAVLDPVAGRRAAAGDRDEELPVPVPVAPAHRAQAQRRLVVSHGARRPRRRRRSAAGHPCWLGSSRSLLGERKGMPARHGRWGKRLFLFFDFFFFLESFESLPLFCPVGTCRVALPRPPPRRGMEAWGPHVRVRRSDS